MSILRQVLPCLWRTSEALLELGHWVLIKTLLDQLLSLAGQPAPGKFLGTFISFRNGFILSPRSMPRHSLIVEVHRQLLALHGLVSCLTCTVICGIFYTRLCAVPKPFTRIVLETPQDGPGCT